MNYPKLLQELTGKPWQPLPDRWTHRLDAFIKKTLPTRERDILERRLDGETQRSIGRSHGIGPARVAHLTNRAIYRLRCALMKKRWLRFSKEEIDRYWPSSVYAADGKNRLLAEQRLREQKPIVFETIGGGETWSVGFAYNPNYDQT